MGKRKISVIAIAVLTCIVCISMIAGATFALFTDNDKVNVSVTTAKLKVSADITNLGTDHKNVEVANSKLLPTYNEETKTLSVNDMLPGDVVTFDVVITSDATVDVKYRMRFGCDDENNELYKQLLLGVKDADAESYQYYVSGVSDWESILFNTDSSKMNVTKNVVIEFPAYVNVVGAEAQSCDIGFAVEAVQANAISNSAVSEEKSVKALRVNSADLTNNVIDDAVIAQLQDEGDCLILDGTTVQDWTIDTTLAKKFSVRGCDVDILTVNAPNATIHYFINNTKIIDVNAVDGQSLYIYGQVASALTVSEGHVVVEQTANVADAIITVSPAVEKIAKVETKVDVKTINVEGAGTADVTVPENVVVGTLEITNTGDKSVVTIDGKAEDVVVDENAAVSLSQKVATADELARAIALGGEIVLTKGIEIAQLIDVNKDIVIDLGGNTLSTLVEGGRPLNIRKDGTSLAIKNGNLVIPESNIKSYGFVNVTASNCNVDLNKVTMIGDTNVGAFIRVIEVVDTAITLTETNATTNYLVIAMQNAQSGSLTVNGGKFVLIDKDSPLMANDDQQSSYFAGFNIWSGLLRCVDDLVAEFNDVVIESESRLGVSISASTVIYNNCTIGNPQANDYAGYLATAVATSNEGKVIVNGGTYEGKQALHVFNSGGTITVNSGTFKGNIAIDLDKGRHDTYGSTSAVILNENVVWSEGMVVKSGTAKEYCTFEYHVSTPNGFDKALNIGADIIVLDADMELPTAINLTDSQALTLNLNDKTLTVDGKKLISTGTGAPIAAKDSSSLKILNGNITPKNYRSAQSTIDMYGTASVVIERVNISRLAGGYRSYGYGVSAFGNGSITINDCTIEAGCAVSTNASEDIAPTITINRSKLAGYSTGLLFNVNGTLNVTDTEIVGINQGVFMRAGTATFTNSNIKTTLQDLGTTNMITISKAAATGTFNPYYTDPNGKDSNKNDHWGSGTQNIPLAALVIGCSKPNGSYWAHASVTLVNTKVDESEEFLATKGEDVGMIHHAILAWNAHGEEGSATFTMDDASKDLLNGTVCTVVGMDYNAAVVE